MSILNSELGRKSEYSTEYDKSLLFPVERMTTRTKMGIDSSIFSGFDEWNCYEVSWLNMKGKPEVRILRIIYPFDSECIVESKSLKLYLNSFNMSRFDDEDLVSGIIKEDLENILKGQVELYIYENASKAFNSIEIDKNLLIDNLDVEIDEYSPNESILITKAEKQVKEYEIYSNLLKTNCPVTGQPDWGTIHVKYQADREIDEESLLRYIVSYRNAQDFHEACCEKIFTDIYKKITPKKLMVKCYYTRRGGIDINPVRYVGYTYDDCEFHVRHWRQ